MKKYIYLSIMSFALSQPLIAMEDDASDLGETTSGRILSIAQPDLKNWNGQDPIGNWVKVVKVSSKRPNPTPENADWILVSAYWLEKATHHVEYAFQSVFASVDYLNTPKGTKKDRSHKVTLCWQGVKPEDLTPTSDDENLIPNKLEDLEPGQVMFQEQGQGEKKFIRYYYKKKIDKKTQEEKIIKGYKFDISKLDYKDFPSDLFPEDLTLLMKLK